MRVLSKGKGSGIANGSIVKGVEVLERQVGALDINAFRNLCMQIRVIKARLKGFWRGMVWRFLNRCHGSRQVDSKDSKFM